MNLCDFIVWIERESRYGTGVTGAQAVGDQPTLDILTSTNARRKRIWRKTDWSWSYEPLSFVVTPGGVSFDVLSVSGRSIDRIWNLIPNDPTAVPPMSGKPLSQVCERKFFEILSSYGPSAAPCGPASDCPRVYVSLGRSAAGVPRVRLFPAPASQFKMGGSAKGVLNTFLIGDVTGIAPFSAGNIAQAINPPFDYFPDGIVEDVLFDGVLSDVLRIQGDNDRADRLNSSFESKVKLLAAEEANANRDNSPITSPLPALILRRRHGGSRW